MCIEYPITDPDWPYEPTDEQRAERESMRADALYDYLRDMGLEEL